MTAGGPGDGSDPVEARAGRRADRGQRTLELRRRRQNRLLPLLGALVVLVVLVVVLTRGGSGPPSSSSASSTPGRGGTSSTAGKDGSDRPAGSTTTSTTKPAFVPPPVNPVISPALAGEGQWVAHDAWSSGPPAVMTTSFRPEPAQPSIVAYASWIRSSTTILALYPGYKGPGPTAAAVDRGPEMVPVAARQNLLATFNSGFYEADSAAGFYAHGILYFPMVDGLATVVQYTNGTVDIVTWSGGPTPDANVEMARQNLPLLVDARAPTAASNTPSEWGVTLGGVPAVWRTGLGIDAEGNLIYVAAPAQTAASLAQILVQVGAVRGMQLDINPEWPIFVTYGGPGAAAPTLAVPNPNQTADRFLFSSTKDFFAVFQRAPGPASQPW